jgi:hypothetical protein
MIIIVIISQLINIATGYVLGGRGSISGKGKWFSSIPQRPESNE